MVCKRQEQCKFGKMCGWAKDEETLLTECVEFIERVPLTNEEWFDDLSTEEKAKWIATQCGNAVMESTYDVSKLRKKRYWVEWLKQPHKPIS